MSASLPDLSSCRRALIIKPSSLGDIVHTLPAVHLLKRRFSGIGFTWLVHPAFAPLLEGNPDLTDTVDFPRPDFRGPSGLWRFGKWLRKVPRQREPGAALDFQGLLRSGLIAKASQAAQRIGFSDSREGARFFHTHIIAVDGSAHAIERSLALPRALGADGPLIFQLPQGNCPSSLIEDSVPPGAVVLHPFSRGKKKSLSISQTLRLCEELAPLPVLLVGRSETLLPQLPGTVRNLINQTTLPELLWLIRRSAAVISVDSGPMHMAAALTPRVLSLHTWSDPRKVGPWHPGTAVWKAGRLMSSGDLDPRVCGLNQDIPDAAIPAIAEWAHGIVSQSRAPGRQAGYRSGNSDLPPT